MYSTVYIGSPVIAYLEDTTNLEILPYLLHFSELFKKNALKLSNVL